MGLALLGCSCSVIFVPLLPEIIESVRDQEGIKDSGTLNDKAAGVFNTAYAVGCIIAPILGGYLSMLTNFRITCDIMAISSAGYALVFFAVIILPSCCGKTEAPPSPLSGSPVPTPRTTQPYQRNRSILRDTSARLSEYG